VYEELLGETLLIYTGAALDEEPCMTSEQFENLIDDLALTDLFPNDTFEEADADSGECVNVTEAVAWVKGLDKVPLNTRTSAAHIHTHTHSQRHTHTHTHTHTHQALSPIQ